MKFNIFLSTIVIVLSSNLITGQITAEQIAFSSLQSENDSLIIERQTAQKIKLIWSYKKNIRKTDEWKQLLADFQSDYSKVIEDIPNYSFYSIRYIQKQNLVVDEVRGKETYTVNENNGMDYVKSNICVLRSKNLKLSIEFNDKKELLDPSIEAEIETAIAQIKNKFYFSSVTPERHYYSVANSSMLPNPKPRIKFFIPLGARLGVLKNQAYIELRPGIGLMRDKRYYIALNWNVVTQYSGTRDQTEYDSYVGLTTGSIGAGFGSEFAFKVKSNIEENDGIFLRAGINYRTKSGIMIGADYYLSDNEISSQELLFGFHVGFGF